VVCNISPTCCTVGWDSACVSLAREHCCGTPGCGSGCNGECLVAHPTPYCNDPACCDAVCRDDPLCCAQSWDSMCAAAAYARCASACGTNEAGHCWAEHELPGCSHGDCCGHVCVMDPACCTVQWDANCVTAADDPRNAAYCKRPIPGSPTAGEPCTPHDNPATNNKPCGDAVCALDAYCCQFAWDSNCVDLARTVPSCGCTYACGDSCAGSCCRAHANANCDDPACCRLVCAQDAYCCETEWDSVCASIARQSCSGANDACPVPPCGSSLLPSCCTINVLPNCSDQACCAAVCRVDSFCCTIQWDSSCAQQARSGNFSACRCDDGGCGSSSAGSCYSVHASPSCSDLGCCQTVCAYEASCCDTAWDANCVTIANFFCGGSFNGLLDAYGAGIKPFEQGRVQQPPKGWIPPRERAKLRQVPKPTTRTPIQVERPAGPAGTLPRTDASRTVPPGTASEEDAPKPAPAQTAPAQPAPSSTPGTADGAVPPPAGKGSSGKGTTGGK
jgi:hypothetical protein